jgi:hypothetical protein
MIIVLMEFPENPRGRRVFVDGYSTDFTIKDGIVHGCLVVSSISDPSKFAFRTMDEATYFITGKLAKPDPDTGEVDADLRVAWSHAHTLAPMEATKPAAPCPDFGLHLYAYDDEGDLIEGSAVL